VQNPELKYSIKGDDDGYELSAAASLKAIKEAMRAVPDHHVMLETLRKCPLENNSLERDYYAK
jgi:hypothetical protein